MAYLTFQLNVNTAYLFRTELTYKWKVNTQASTIYFVPVNTAFLLNKAVLPNHTSC